MSNYRVQNVAALHDFVTGALIGLYGADGREYFPLLSGANGTPGNVTAANGVNFYSNVTVNASFTCSPANLNVVLSPTGTGTVTIAPATGGTINNMDIGTVTRKGGSFSALSLNKTDTSGTPGAATINGPAGRVAIAAGASSVVVTNSLATAGGSVMAIINQATADATLTQIVRVATAAGSLTIYGNANATANTVVDFMFVGF